MKYTHKGRLRHNNQGRYEFDMDTTLHQESLKGRMEYSHVLEDYYFCIEDGEIYINNLNRLRVRI